MSNIKKFYGDSTMQNNDEKKLSVIINTIYMMSLSMDLMIREAERIMRRDNATFRREKRQIFNRFMKAVNTACILQEELTQDIYREDEKHNYKNVQIWQDEANELARLVLLYADRSADQEVTDAIFKFIREQPCEGIVDEKMLESFYLKK